MREILAHAIRRGGTTLRDFLSPDGAPGYFEQELLVYGREGEPCRTCGRPLKGSRLGQRATATVLDVPKSTPRACRFGPPGSVAMTESLGGAVP